MKQYEFHIVFEAENDEEAKQLAEKAALQFYSIVEEDLTYDDGSPVE